MCEKIERSRHRRKFQKLNYYPDLMGQSGGWVKELVDCERETYDTLGIYENRSEAEAVVKELSGRYGIPVAE